MTGTPHDTLAKLTFSRPALAAEEILHVLGPRLAAQIDPASIRLIPGSFVSQEMKDREPDMLYEAKLGGQKILIYTLLECQSTPDRWMPLRVLGYKVAAWESFLRQHPGAPGLPIILSIVLFHGDKPWSWSTAFESLFHLPPGSCDELRLHIPRFDFLLDDLAARTEAELRARGLSPHLLLVLLALAYARRAPSLEGLLFRLLDLIQELADTDAGRAALKEVFCYLAQVRGRGERETFAKIAAAMPRSHGEKLMETIADSWFQEGRDEGLKAGRDEGLKAGQHKVLLRLLRVRFGELPAAVVQRVTAADEPLLERWTDRVLVAKTLKAVFAGP